MSLFGSEKDEQKLINASRTLYDCVYIFVSSSNIIFRMLNQYLKTDFPNFVVKENLSIKENFQLLISALKEMQESMETQANMVQQQIGDPLISKIKLSSSKEERMKLVKEISSVFTGALPEICGRIATVLLRFSNLPEKLETVLRSLANSPVITLRVGDLLLSHEEIANALPSPSPSTSSPSGPSPGLKSHSQSTSTVSLTSFLRSGVKGHSGKNTLEVAIKCMEDVVKILKPVCDSFQNIVKTAEEYATLIANKTQ